MLTVVGIKGSTPRELGARMLWRPDAEMQGTIGGGQFEHLALASAKRVFRDRTRIVEQFVLGAEAEQCCGGVMEVLIEYVGPALRLVLFGAGHVSKALLDVLHDSPFEVIVADDRKDWNAPGRFGPARQEHDYERAVAMVAEAPSATFVCVMTCSHETDFELLRAILQQPTLPAFVGLIGSRSKRVSLFSKLVASGVPQDRVQRVHCPIGIGDTGKEPQQIAISIAAQLLLEARQHAGG